MHKIRIRTRTSRSGLNPVLILWSAITWHFGFRLLRIYLLLRSSTLRIDYRQSIHNANPHNAESQFRWEQAILNWRMRLQSMNEERKRKAVCFRFLFSHRSQWWPSRTLRELEAMTHRKVRKPIGDVRNIFQNSTTCTFHNFAGF